MKKIITLLSGLYNNKKALVVSIAVLSCIFSIIFLTFFRGVGPAGHMVLGSDYSQCYAPIAQNIINGKDIILNKDYVRCAPGYPFLLVPIFWLSDFTGIGAISLIVFSNILLTAFCSVMLFLIVSHIFNKRVALISSLFWVSYPFGQWLIKNPNTEVPFIALLLFAIFIYLRFLTNNQKISYVFLTGLLLGIAALVRPIGMLIPLVLMILLFFLVKASLKKKIVLALLMILGTLVFILPWELYALSKTGNLMPLSTGGPATIREGFYFGSRLGEGGDQFKSSPDVMEFMDNVRQEKVIDNKSYSELFNLLKRETLKSPMAFIKIMSIKVARSWYATSQMWLENKILLVQLPYLVLGFCGVALALRRYKNNIASLIVLLAVIGYFWGMTTATLSIMRYMIPAMALVVIFSALAFDILILDKFKKYMLQVRQGIWQIK